VLEYLGFDFFSIVDLLSGIGSSEDSSRATVVDGATDELTYELTEEELGEFLESNVGSSSVDSNWILDIMFPELKF